MRSFVFKVPNEISSASLMPEPGLPPRSIQPRDFKVILPGECEFLRSQDSQSYVYSGDTSSCLQIALFGKTKEGVKELCLIHWNSNFQLNWADVIKEFQSTEISMKIIGAIINFDISQLNLNELENSFKHHSSSNADSKEDLVVTITLVAQCVLKGEGHALSADGYRHLLWDIDGNCYDGSALKLKPIEICNSYLRKAREDDSALRTLFDRYFGLTLDKPIIQCRADSQTQFLPSYFVLATIHCIVKNNRLDKYLNFITTDVYGENESARAEAFKQDLLYFVFICLYFIKKNQGVYHTFPYMYEITKAMTICAPEHFLLIQDETGYRTQVTDEKIEEAGISVCVTDQKMNTIFGVTFPAKFNKYLIILLNMAGWLANGAIILNEGRVSIPYQYVKELLIYESRYLKDDQHNGQAKNISLHAMLANKKGFLYIVIANIFAEIIQRKLEELEDQLFAAENSYFPHFSSV